MSDLSLCALCALWAVGFQEPDATCGPHRDWLTITPTYPGNGSEPTTPHFMGAIHPRVKFPLGQRLARAAWGTTYAQNNGSAFTGPVLSGCSLTSSTASSSEGGEGGTVLELRFDSSLLRGDVVELQDYNR